MRRASVRRLRILAASLAHNLARFGWAAVEQVLVQRASALVIGQPAVELLCFIEFDSYDVVDLTLGVVGRPKKPMVLVARPVDDVAVDDQLLPIDAPADLAEPPLSAMDRKPGVGVQKVLQNEGFSVMLVRMGNRCHVLQGNRASHLQVSDRTTGETLLEHVKNRMFAVSNARHFRRRVLLTCTDAASSNEKAKKYWHAQHPERSCFGVHCHVHMLHSVHKRVFHLVDFQITGMLNAALCPRGGRQMSHLRAALARTIRSRICFVVGPISQDALNFKHFALDELFGMGSETACLKILLLRCCPGDCWNEDGFKKILRPGETQERALKMLEDLLVPFSCRRSFWVYPRSR